MRNIALRTTALTVAVDRDSHIGRLDKALDESQDRGWMVVSMKDDWKSIFPANSLSPRPKP